MLSTRNLSKAFAKYLSPKVVAVPIGKLEHTPVVEGEAEDKYLDSNATLTKGGVKVAVAHVPVGLFKQVQRFSHTDVNVPDFTDYRRANTKDPSVPHSDTEISRRAFTYVVVAGMGVTGANIGKNIAIDFISTMSASADVLAVSKVEVDLNAIPMGKNVTIKWRGKPLFVRHRTDAEVEEMRSLDVDSLRHPERDEDRVKHPNFLVTLGVCTHLGCVPIANAGDFGGYYCPCHGSHYDGSGRIRKGPAPYNLEVPYYDFMDENTLLVG